jgi:hypothetical protein
MTDSKATEKPVSGMRCWDIEYVKAECPHCGMEVKVKPDELWTEALWHSEQFEQECDWCYKYFWIEVDDDDR